MTLRVIKLGQKHINVPTADLYTRLSKTLGIMRFAPDAERICEKRKTDAMIVSSRCSITLKTMTLFAEIARWENEQRSRVQRTDKPVG